MSKGCKAEILAPAGSFESIEAAVRCGADAVYLGSKDFSARHNAQNFDNEELLRAVEYCHERGVKVHLAVNTALYDDELKSCEGLIEYAALIGVDALIVSDLGVLSLAKNICPSLSLHASTQMGILSPSGVVTAHKLGFDRAVLARELSKNEISEIIKASPIETEVFVHGALCMSVSGQCYLSALLGKRSGNRGRCAQPCRLNFSLGSGNEYVLSLKDNSLYEHINDLCKMGVTSLKIEGRMKRPEYTAAAVSLIRAAMNGQDYNEFLSLSRDIFSRSGFTDGYFKGEINKKMFGFREHEDVLRAENAIPTLHNLYRREVQRVPIKASLKLKENEQTKLIFEDNDKNIVTVYGEMAQNNGAPLSKDVAVEKIGRLGATPYYINDFELENKDNLSCALSGLNSLRRVAAEKLSLLRKTPPKREIYAPESIELTAKLCGKRNIYARFETLEQLKACIDECDSAILPIRECLKIARDRAEFMPYKNKIVIELDRAPFSSDSFIKKSLVELKESGFSKICIQNIGQLEIVKEIKMSAIYGPFMNVYNSRAVKFLKSLGVDEIVASFELPYKKIENLAPFTKIGALVYGYIPTMITRACPVKNINGCKDCKKDNVLTDRLGTKFTVSCKGNVSEILNSVPLCTDFSKHSFDYADFVLCYFTKEDKKRCKEVLFSTKNMLPMEKSSDFTRGLYKNGVI